MSRRSLWYLSLSGYVAPIWLLMGVTIASQFYAGYSHYHQMLSELGAIGSPTASVSPVLNNYPLAVLFSLFGFCVAKAFPDSKGARISGYMIVVHGVGTFFAGFLPCDFECPWDSTSTHQLLHGVAGGVMFLSLTVANILWVLIPSFVSGRGWFRWFSLATFIVSLGFLMPMLKAMDIDSGAGLYQRLNYGVSLIWLMVLAHVTVQKARVQAA